MQKLGKRVLYHDTDSIIFSVKDGEYVPPLGTYLGQLTDELTCKELGLQKTRMLRTLDRRVCKLWSKELLFQSEYRRNCL